MLGSIRVPNHSQRSCTRVRARYWVNFAFILACFCATGVLPAAETERIRVGVLQFGTVNWELDTITTHGLAAREGLELEVVPLGSKQATSVAIQGGAVDVIVTDWIWVSRQRAAGRPYTFVPYSTALGGLIVRPDAGIDALDDLSGQRVGVAGGPVDKSWLLLRAYAKRSLGTDLTELVEPSFAAPPLLNQLMLRGDFPAVLNFWHYAARLKAAGMRELISVAQILAALGVHTPVPMLGWVFNEELIVSKPDVVQGFLRASYAAKHMLLDSDSEWQRLQPLLKAQTDATARALRDAYRAGIPRAFGAPEQAAALQVFSVLAREGGEALVGPSAQLSAGTFWDGFEVPSWQR